MSGSPAIAPGRPAGDSPAVSVRAVVELTKIHLSLYIALAALAGQVLAAGRFSRESLAIGLLTLVLACGSAVLNNVQDREWDCCMPRTRRRLLVRRRELLGRAAALGIVLVTTGLAGIYLICESVLPFLLGLSALVCYNGLYTPLKKVSLWAMVPGTICGMIPPAMGWTAVPEIAAASDASGLWIVTAALGIWQLPHYLLICLRHPHTGERPGFHQIWSQREIRWQILVWTGVFSLCLALFPVQGWILSAGPAMLVMGISLVLPVSASVLLMSKNARWKTGLVLGMINLSMLAFLGASVLDRI